MHPVEDYFERLKKLTEIEEAEEIRAFREEFERLSPEERELAGKALLRIQPIEFWFSPDGHALVSFRYADEKFLPIYSPEAGDLVSLEPSGTSQIENVVGTVYDKESDRITVAFREEQDSFFEAEGLYDLYLSGSRATYKRIYEGLKEVRQATHNRLAYLRDVLIGIKAPESFDPISRETITFFNDFLNDWQKQAVAKALASRDVFLLHGPPGTGKTTTLVELVRQCSEAGQFVFVTAPSNTACDQMLESLIKSGACAVRLGHPARIMGHLRKHTVDYLLQNHAYAGHIRELEKQLSRLYLTRERRRERRALDWEEKANLREEIHRLKTEIRELGSQVWHHLKQSFSIVVGTHASARDAFLRGREIDLLVIDEASQSFEPLTWFTLPGAKKVVMAGDHCQLPPTVKSDEAVRQGLSETLFEKIHRRLPEASRWLLRRQYRMHEKIMQFSSTWFYQNQLEADASVREHTLSDLPGVKANPETTAPFCFLDTAGAGYEEQSESGSQSRLNVNEAELLIKQLHGLLESGVKATEIAVISPYSAQVRLLTRKIANPQIEIDTVDGFQGREKEAVLVSLVRSNLEGEIGFLADIRRMNVAMTRAKRKLIMIGDSATLAQIPFYADLIQYAETIQGIKSVWEYYE